jgi:CubicO group peptidase (beta-lactamase class C family)
LAGRVAAADVDARFEAALRRRLADEGVGIAAAQVGPMGVKLHTHGVLRQGSTGVITAQTLFDFGSMTKAFVALALADGVLRGEWAMDDPVAAALPDGVSLRDAKGDPLRLVDLATHRSGLPRMPGDLRQREMVTPYGHYDQRRLHNFLRDWKPSRARGEAFEYSNLGYGLLALELARRAGISVDELLERRVFAPLGMGDQYIRRPLPAGDDMAVLGAALKASLATRDREASGHQARRPAHSWQFDALAGAIGVVGTVETAARFMQAALGLVAHPLGKAFEMCLQQHTEGEHPMHPFGLAWEIAPIVGGNSPRMLFNQDGATSGFSSSLWIEPGRRRGCVVLANAFMETRSLALLGLDPEISNADFSRTHLTPEALASIAGNYVLDGRIPLNVRVRTGRLHALGPGIPEFELLPQTSRRFFTRDNLLRVEFDAAAEPQHLILFAEGQARRTFIRKP